MLYLFDANVLITASNVYYPLDAVPEFWEWIDYHAVNERIELPVEILDEVLAGGMRHRLRFMPFNKTATSAAR